ncbi:MAG: SIS domain-containing protein [Acidobacteriota bacterium]|nr:SIS domain-containing protein [Acidobacteriota bacterium]
MNSPPPTHMLAEIYEQPAGVRATAQDAGIRDALVQLEPELARIGRILIAGTGTSRHAGVVAKFMIEGLAHIPTEVEYSSELQHGSSLPGPETLVIVISQSGETADTVSALRTARRAGARVLAISNVNDATMMYEADFRLHTKCGPERSVPSTKAFTAQLAALYLLALAAGKTRKRLTASQYKTHLDALLEIPAKLETALTSDGLCRELAGVLMSSEKFIFAGRGIHRGVAFDAALKFKETTYRCAQAYAGGEVWHGPLATVDLETAVFLLATRDRRDKQSEVRYEHTLSNLQSLKGRARAVIAIGIEGDDAVARAADVMIPVPSTSEYLLPLLEIVPLQLFAYHVATQLGHDVDRPRNLTKAVLQERL